MRAPSLRSPWIWIVQWAFLAAGVSLALAACGLLGDPGYIAYTVGPEGNRNIGVVRPDGSQLRTIVAHSADDFAPRWSPNRQLLAFLSNRDGNVELYVAPADGSSAMRATNTLVAESRPVWSPDSQSLAYVSPDRDGNPHVFLINIAELVPRRLTFGTTGETDPAWSPDGQWIAFAAVEEDGTSLGIFLRNPNGVNRVHLTHSDDRAPAWSPDSKQLAFVSERDGNQEVYTVNVGGREGFPEPVRITENPGADYAPAWSPNGKRIAFLSLRDGHTGIYTVSPTGEGLTALTRNEAEEQALVWGPNGDLAFISELTDKPGLFIMTGDGEDQRLVGTGDAVYALPDW
jgi:Tol biopolymer transport system component